MIEGGEGSPAALRRVIAERIIPALRGGNDRKRPRVMLAETQGSPPAGAGIELHHFPEVCFCLSGLAEIWCGAKAQPVEGNDVLIIPPQAPHSAAVLHCITRDPASADSRLLWVRTFPYGAVLNLCRTARGMHRNTVHRVFLQRRIHTVVESAIEELQQRQPFYEEMAASHLVEALIWIWRGADVGSADLPAPQPAATAAGDASIAGRACRFIEESFDSRLDLDVIARAAGTTRSQLCREFRRKYGSTVMEHLAQVRIDAGKRLLLARMRVSDVAGFVGFGDPFHFSRVFKRITGQSPKQFADEGVEIKDVHPK